MFRRIILCKTFHQKGFWGGMWCENTLGSGSCKSCFKLGLRCKRCRFQQNTYIYIYIFIDKCIRRYLQENLVYNYMPYLMIVSFLWWWTSPVNKVAWQNSTRIFGFWSTKPLDVKGAWFMAFSRPITGFVMQIRCPDFSSNSWQSLPQQDYSKWTLAEPKQHLGS